MFVFFTILLLANYGLALLILALIIAFFDWQLHRQEGKLSAAEILFRWLALLPIGVAGILGFIMHTFAGDFTASTIGWANSPFQYEVAVANLGFGILGILAFKASLGFRLATAIGNIFWLWGDALGHIYQMITQHNYAPGNAGSWFWFDVLVPALLLICIISMVKQHRNTYFNPDL